MGHFAKFLQEATLADEEESDRLAEGFLAGDVALEDFGRRYLEVRARHHARKAKSDKLKTQWPPPRF